MKSSSDAGRGNWLRDFIAGAVDEARLVDSTGSAESPAPAWMDLIDGLSPGESIGAVGPYRIDRLLGRGGMGVVFQAFDSTLRRPVAIKFLSPRLAVSPLARTRFTREAQAAAAVSHPNVVTIHAIAEHEGLPYMVMEYVAGITLAERLNREGVLQPKSILRIGIQCARGLAVAHAQGLIHRDVKPGNLLLESGIDRVKITDFGLANVAAEPWRLTASGVLLGTPAYMSPEQAVGAALDHRSDLFSLGSLLYQMCTGEPPFPGPSVKAILTRVRYDEPRPIRDLNPDIPPPLEAHVSRLMAKNPADRFASANELVRTLGTQLAETQGRSPDQSLDDPTTGLAEAELAPAHQGEETFEVVAEWDGPEPRPWAKGGAGASHSASWKSLLGWPFLKIVGRATGVLVAAIVLNSLRPWLARASADDSIKILLALAGLAVLIWVSERFLQALGGHHVATPSKRGAPSRMRNTIATATLFAVLGAGCLEWSAYTRAQWAELAVEARRDALSPAPLGRQEVEELIGRAADETLQTHVAWQTATYRWNGVFRSYAFNIDYWHERMMRVRQIEIGQWRVWRTLSP
jgi:serine/threonine protein kinase